MIMKSRVILFISFLVLFSVLLTSCIKAEEEKMLVISNTEIAFMDETECVQLFNPIGVITSGVEVQEIDVPDISPKNWEKVGELIKGEFETYDVISLAAWNKNELWISYSINNESGIQKELLKYDLKNEEKTFYSSDPAINLPGKLFFSTDGTLWLLNDLADNPDNLPFLSRYNPDIDRFEPVMDGNGILQPPQNLIAGPLEDAEGKFWFVISEADTEELSVYHFDPETLVIEKSNLLVPNTNSKVAISTDKKTIWVVNTESGELTQYTIKTKDVYTFNTLPKRYEDDLPRVISKTVKAAEYAFFDNSDQLWLKPEVWINLSDPDSPEFNSLLTSPLFIEYDKENQNPFSKSTVLGMLESSDGYIWFMTSGGVIRLDISGNYRTWDWCMLTNGPGKVVEDQEHNLWMVVFNGFTSWIFRNRRKEN